MPERPQPLLERLPRRVAAVIQRVATADMLVLAWSLAAVLGLLAFILIADAVGKGRTSGIDERLMRALRDPSDLSDGLGPAWVEGAMRDFTALGSSAVLVLFTLAVAVGLAARRQYHALLLVVAATAGGLILGDLLKAIFARPRPTVVPHLTTVRSLSFPSGHSLHSAVVYLTLGALLARFVRERHLKVYFIAVAAFLTFLVGLSRVYLGVHYPTDVLAGWAAGLAWALACWLTARRAQRTGSVEKAQ